MSSLPTKKPSAASIAAAAVAALEKQGLGTPPEAESETAPAADVAPEALAAEGTPALPEQPPIIKPAPPPPASPEEQPRRTMSVAEERVHSYPDSKWFVVFQFTAMRAGKQVQLRAGDEIPEFDTWPFSVRSSLVGLDWVKRVQPGEKKPLAPTRHYAYQPPTGREPEHAAPSDPTDNDFACEHCSNHFLSEGSLADHLKAQADQDGHPEIVAPPPAPGAAG